ncbi:MAG: hypothetical protein H0V17_29600 [Deltaproteobacteria bacterium]|nr:hypothetical protein [Deltaproteobacteria bacterium]
MKSSTIAFVAILLIALVQPAYAGRVVHNSTRISIEIPQEWESEFKDDAIVMQDHKDEVEIVFMSVDDAVIKQVVKAVTANLEKKIKKLKFGKPTETKINGMLAIVMQGDGFLGNLNVDVAVVIVDAPPRDKDLLAIAIAEDAKLSKHKANIQKVFDSLRPAN